MRNILCVLFLLPVIGAAQEIPYFTTDFPPEEFAARRAKIFDKIGPNAIALVQGAPSPSGYVRFRQSNEFYYLSGIEVPHAYLLLNGATRQTRLEKASAIGFERQIITYFTANRTIFARFPSTLNTRSISPRPVRLRDRRRLT
jgi:hypothetical protein